MLNKIIDENLKAYIAIIDYNIGVGAALSSVCFSVKCRNVENDEIINEKINNFLKRIDKCANALEKVSNQLKIVQIPRGKRKNVIRSSR